MNGDETHHHVEGVRQGSEESFAALYERVSPSLLAWAKLRTLGAIGRRVDAEDLLQETWWRALESFDRFDVSKGRFRQWIFGIAAKVLLKMSRQDGTSAREREVGPLHSSLQAQLTSIRERSARRDRVESLVDEVSRLSDDEQRLFLGRVQGLSHLDLGKALGVSEAAAQKRWERLKASLAETEIVREMIEDA